MTSAPVDGMVEPGFEPVAESFVRGLEKGELGAAVAAYVDGRKVVDLWGGWADAQRTREWKQTTIACTYSSTKGMTATCAHHLADRGLLDVDEPVATYWPEFGQAGKENVTIRMLLNHQAGRPRPRSLGSGRAMDGSEIAVAKRFDWETMTSAMAVGTPLWEPGTRCEYHGGEFGYLVGGVIQRIDGRRLGTYFREEIAEPLGADYLIEVAAEDDHRCAEMTGPEEMVGGANTREWRAAGDGAATSFGTADGLARVYAALSGTGSLDGVRVLRSETIEAAVQEQPLARVPGGGTPGDFGLGYQLLWKIHPTLPIGSFGHTGIGGSIGLADPGTRLGFGYVMNQMGSNGAAHLLSAIYRSLAA
ncbi:MAG TPA: serine hydrolase domain-containing protein [Acidimicrobiales bacterium]|nr:serine hydrolase domain-containing protein [Acidimicrobiales bacterium]